MSLDESLATADGPVDSGAPQPPGPAPAPAGTRRRRPHRGLVVAGAAVVALLLVLVVATLPRGGPQAAVERVAADPAVVPAERTVIDELWSAYKAQHLQDGRALDHSLGGITTSEGQSYTMLRAVWSDDRTTFDSAWRWTKDNLGRDDRLNAWRFGPLPDGSWGVDPATGGGSATDAEVDMAFALLMAYSRWQDEGYLYDAVPLIEAIWTYEVVDVAGRPVLAANDSERNNAESVLVNPSYIAPYAFRAFARVDPAHDWDGLVDSSYALLDQVTAAPLSGAPAAGLPPDWVRLDRTTGGATAADLATNSGASTDFGYEALRLPWRLALDARWHDEPRAQRLLEQQAEVLGAAWTSGGSLAAVYTHDGRPAVDYPSTAMDAGALGAFEVADPELAQQLYTRELLPLYDADTRAPVADLGYYDANWAWFAMALHLDRLPDLTDPQGSDLP